MTNLLEHQGGPVSRPLAGVRVVDLTHALSGPFCTHQLQLLGADVLKVEAPGPGDDFRARPGVFPAINAGKRSMTLNLKSADGLAILGRLLEGADVLIENYRPGVAARLGLTWERLHEQHPRLIYCSISGYGQEGPLKDTPAIEWAVQAMSGMTASYVTDDMDHRRLGLGVLDVFSGYVAFSAIMAAVLQRQQDGQGRRIDVAMLDAALTLMSGAVSSHFLGSEERQSLRPTMARFPARDRSLFIAALHPTWFEGLCRILGAPELLDDPRFADHAARQRNADALTAALEARTATFPADELERALVAAGLPASIVRTLPEILAHPHVQGRGILRQVQSETGEPLTLVGPAFQFSGGVEDGVEDGVGDGEGAGDGGGALGFQGPVPALGQHTESALAELGYAAEEIARLRAGGAI
jgi:crotonobetainyl-CoA:carnitine CoA-transferase CaiB-like acyl-CoA transferase